MKKNLCNTQITLAVILLIFTFGCSKDESNDNNSPTLTIGQSYEGGIIVYVDGTGQHGLICAPYDQATSLPWSNGSFIRTHATGTSVGTGQANTTAIVNSQGTGNYAAQICNDLVLSGYNDWFLPSKDELNILYQVMYMKEIGSFLDVSYWSSTEVDSATAYAQDFRHYGVQSPYTKSYSPGVFVRAIRAF
jgi:hypothetical protein